MASEPRKPLRPWEPFATVVSPELGEPAPVRESCDNPFGRSAAKRREVDHGRA